MAPNIEEFVERAKAAGASEQSLVGILTARGWPEKEVYAALASQYERVIGMEIPTRKGTGTAAKDAFFHLLVFSTLATWTIGLGSLAFTLIDRWLADDLFMRTYSPGYDMYTAAWSIASVLVAFPIYLLVSRAVLQDESFHPEKLNSPVRKWLTYMALVVAACIFIGDLITALTFFLRGEITSRFLAKALVVLVLSGGVFFYYFGGLRRTEKEAGPQTRSNRDRSMAAISALIVVGSLISGFAFTGSPKTQRTLRADQRRTEDLYWIAGKINGNWAANGNQLPQHLDELHGVAVADPVTRAAYEYRVIENSRYELCAKFALPSQAAPGASSWFHPAGRYCFALDASRVPDNPSVYLPD
jgi:Domain of unknown function (DUF5671)